MNKIVLLIIHLFVWVGTIQLINNTNLEGFWKLNIVAVVIYMWSKIQTVLERA